MEGNSVQTDLPPSSSSASPSSNGTTSASHHHAHHHSRSNAQFDSDDEPIVSLFSAKDDPATVSFPSSASPLELAGEDDADEEALMKIKEDDEDEDSSDGHNKTNGTANGNGSANGKPEESSKKDERQQERVLRDQQKIQFDQDQKLQQYNRLKFLLEKTGLYSQFLSQRIAPSEQAPANANTNNNNNNNGTAPASASANGTTPTKGKATGRKGANKKKRKYEEKQQQVEAQQQQIQQIQQELQQTQSDSNKKQKQEQLAQRIITNFPQPKLITGGDLRPYQLAGVEWLVSLYENGLNGILADEMGLGKTVQCISLLAHLIAHGVSGPFLIIGPLSTLANWVREIQMWTSNKVPVIMYHGDKKEREQLRLKHLRRTNKDFPVVVCSYEMVIRDRKYLTKFHWKYLIVDEGHRVKNFNCKLLKDLRTFTSANRLLLTGTPLQNNLRELWSMLNFLLPDIFDDVESFERWFDFSSIGEKAGHSQIIEQEEQNQIVTKLHDILRPFLLRRLKTDVELELPKKQEKLVFTGLSKLQTMYYKATLEKNLDKVLSEESQRQLKNSGSSLQNMLMQLRKVCNHPFLFEWPTNKKGEDIIDESMILSSGKMMVLDRILSKMYQGGHKVLIFSQMTRMLDILQDYMVMRGYQYSRIDGSSPQQEREANIQSFNNRKDVFCFLLSTRAGGLGINLTAADTVIFYDNDWNPQMDLQAQDRCHRIGQTKPVKVYRFATANSIESRILERQSSKMKLEQLVIQKGNFLGVKSKSKISVDELQELLETETPNDNTSAGKVTEKITDDFLFQWDD